MSRGQDFSKVGFDPLVVYVTDLMGCDRVKRMSVFCMGKDKFFVELVSIMYIYTFMSVRTSSPCRLSFLWGLSLKSHCLIDQIQTSHHLDALFFPLSLHHICPVSCFCKSCAQPLEILTWASDCLLDQMLINFFRLVQLFIA